MTLRGDTRGEECYIFNHHYNVCNDEEELRCLVLICLVGGFLEQVALRQQQIQQHGDFGILGQRIQLRGSNTVDTTVIPARAPLTETKFNVAPAGGPAARTLTGMSYRDVGAPAGTVVVTSGSGASKSVPGIVGGTNWECKWDISLNVTPGAPAASVAYDVSASADDPITMPVGTFDDNTNGRTSLYLPVVLSDLDYESGGAGGFSVAYKTDGGITELLSLNSSAANGVSAHGDEPDFLRIYLLDTPLENPMAMGKPSYSLSELRDVMSDKMKNNKQDGALQLGFLLEDIPVPTTEISSGILAEIHIGSRLSESFGSHPEQQRKIDG